MNSGYQKPIEIYRGSEGNKEKAAHKLFPKSMQKLVNAFAFFLAFPFIDILGNSITFYIFIILLLRTGQVWLMNFRYKVLFAGFFAACVISIFNAPDMPRHPGWFSDLLIVIQVLYWIMVSLFFVVFYRRINWYQTCKYILIGTICLSVVYFLAPLRPTGSVLSFGLAFTKNGYVFNIISVFPFCMFFLEKKFNGKYTYLSILLFVLLVFLTEGRAGSIIILIQGLMMVVITRPQYKKYLYVFLAVGIVLFVYIETDKSNDLVRGAAEQVYKINPRLALLMVGQGEGDLSFDRSWLERRLLVDKAKEIIKDYPLFGVGLGRFRYFDANIVSFYGYSRLHKHSLDYFNSRSAHNSYMMVLAETGYTGFIFFVLIMVIPVLYFIRIFLSRKISLYHLPFISMLGIAIHFYVVVAFTGALAWMVIGTSYAAMFLAKRTK